MTKAELQTEVESLTRTITEFRQVNKNAQQRISMLKSNIEGLEYNAALHNETTDKLRSKLERADSLRECAEKNMIEIRSENASLLKEHLRLENSNFIYRSISFIFLGNIIYQIVKHLC